MNCESASERLQEYVDGQLAGFERQELEAHLESCAACRSELALLAQVDEALAQLPVLPEPQDLHAQIMAQVRTSPHLQPLAAFRLRWEDAAISAAFAWAAVAALALSFYLLTQEATPPRALLYQAWWTWMARLDRLWHLLQPEAVYLAGTFSSLCVAAAVAAGAVALTRYCLVRRGNALWSPSNHTFPS
jgi:anti-sigma factor RsiW